MPKLAPSHPDDRLMGPVHGVAGNTRAWGLYLHRYELDVSNVGIQSVDDFAIFEPDSSVLPVMIVYASITWELDDTFLDSAEISIGGNPGVSDLLQGTPIDQASNGDVMGNMLNHHSTTGLLIRMQGSSTHEHWAKVLTGYAGGDPVIDLPVKLRVNAGPASANPYSGTIKAHLLWTPLRAF